MFAAWTQGDASRSALLCRRRKSDHAVRSPSISAPTGPQPEGRHFTVHLFAHTKRSQKAGSFSVARLKMDLPFHIRSAFTGVVPALLVRLMWRKVWWRGGGRRVRGYMAVPAGEVVHGQPIEEFLVVAGPVNHPD